MDEQDINSDFGENVVLDDEPEQTQEDDTIHVLESVGIIKDGKVVDVPPPMTPTQQQKEYKRKMTEKRLESLRKAREAKALKRKNTIEQKAQEKIKPIKRIVQASKEQTETEDERVERLVQARLQKQKPTQPKATRETEDERVERLVQERLKRHTPTAPTADPAREAKQEREAYFSKLMFG
jgi:ABC-type multidrug transport system ATPase subunit